MSSGRGVASFLVRFTQERYEGRDGEAARWRGHIRHVQDGAEQSFGDFSEAVRFMQEHLDSLTRATAGRGESRSPEQVMRDGFRLWGQLAANAGQLMADAALGTLKTWPAGRAVAAPSAATDTTRAPKRARRKKGA